MSDPNPESNRNRQRAVFYLFLFATAALYIRVGAFATLEPTDEGIVVYPAWRVAQGALPYRDIQQIYGPGVFYVNAGIFRLLGEDLANIRWSLVALRALIGLLVYMAARRVASRFASLLVWSIFVAIWGSPIWLFNSPYASHYGLALSLIGLLALPTEVGAIQRRSPVLAGLCLGFAALFKQTLGASYAIAFGGALILRPKDDGAHHHSPRGSRRRAPAALSPLILFGASALVLVGSGLTSWSTALLTGPMATGVVWAFRHAAQERQRIDRDLLLVGLGALLPLAGCALLYWYVGALPALLYDTIRGLPQKVAWFVGLATPTWHTVSIAASATCCLALPRVLVTPGRAGARAMGWGGAGLVSAAMAFTTPQSVWGWVGDVINVALWIPIVGIVVFMGPTLAATWKNRRSANDRGFATALWLFAAASLLQLYPAADLAHIGMVLPASLPLIARAIDWFRLANRSSGQSPSGSPTLAVCSAALALLVSAPFLNAQLNTVSQRPENPEGFARASGVWTPAGRWKSSVALVRKLREDPSDVFVLSNQTLFYFLAARPSLFDRQQFVLYLVGTDLIVPEDARRLLAERQIIETLAAKHPLIVDEEKSAAAQLFRATFPTVAQFISEHYRSAEIFGNYQLRRWSEAESES